MATRRSFDDALAPLRALPWQELLPAEQRALFAQLTVTLAAMMAQDCLPEGQYRRTNAERVRRTGEDDNKLTLLRLAFESLIIEGLEDEQLHQVHLLSHEMIAAFDAVVQARKL